MNENRYAFLDSLYIGIVILNSDQDIIFTNRWIQSHSKKEIILGCNIKSVLEDSDHRLLNAIKMSLDNGHSSILSHTLNKSSFPLYHGSTKLFYNLIISPYKTKNSNLVILQFIDVTQLKERETFLAAQQQELTQQREKSFFQGRIASFNSMTTNIAHEINNPLSVLETSLIIIKKSLNKVKETPEIVFKNIDDGFNEIKRITNLIKAIRGVTELNETDKFETISLIDIVENTSKSLTAALAQDGIAYAYCIKEAIKNNQFLCAPKEVVMLLNNLIQNSIYELSKIEDIEKWIKLEVLLENENVIFKVSDSGPGIPEEIKKDIFLPFYTTKDIGLGSGLGLSSCLKIAQAHHGEIFLDENSVHTTFTVSIPINGFESS